jgi:CysZ protein
MKKMILHTLSGCGLLTGASYPFRILIFFKQNPSLWSYIIIPLILNLILGIFFYLQLLSWEAEFFEILTLKGMEWLNQIALNLPYWLQNLDIIFIFLIEFFKLLLGLILLVLTGFILAQVGFLLGMPWYSKLSEKIESIKLGKITIVEVNFLTEIKRALFYELKKIILLVFIGLPLFLCNFLPGFGTLIATIGGLSLTAILTCLDFWDQPLERRRLGFRDKLGLIAKSFPSSAGFGYMCLFLISIPLLNLVTIPLCVAAGTLFVCDRLLPRYGSIFKTDQASP